MRKATIMALELSIDHGEDVLRQRESMIYRLFDMIIQQQPALKTLASELETVDTDDRLKRRALIDPVIDRSIVKLVDLDDDGLSELLIYFNLVANPADGGDVYVFRQQGLSWDCIGRFPSRSCPEVIRNREYQRSRVGISNVEMRNIKEPEVVQKWTGIANIKGRNLEYQMSKCGISKSQKWSRSGPEVARDREYQMSEF